MKRVEYSEFVTEIYTAITEVMPSESKSLLTFAAGEVSRNETNEIAFLRNEKASYFYELLLSNSELFRIDPSGIILQRSLIFKDEIAIRHSCYAKNIRRWMNGQLPRKRRCRAEFAVLAYCWATAFGAEQRNSANHIKCRENIRRLCHRVLGETKADDYPLLDLIWLASCTSYMPQSR